MKTVLSVLFAFCLILSPIEDVMADPDILIVEDKVDFGLVPQMSRFVHDFVIYSIGDKPLIIKELKTFDNCISGEILKSEIIPGDSSIIRVTFDSQTYNGTRNRHPQLITNAPRKGKPILRLHTNALVVDSIESLTPIFVKPYHIVASQFGDSGATEFEFSIVNVSEETVPLRLLHADTTFCHINLPLFVPPKDTAIGRVILTKTGFASEFERSFTFEYIDSDSMKKNYSVPVRRKIYRSSAE